jgi:hypothetical protein
MLIPLFTNTLRSRFDRSQNSKLDQLFMKNSNIYNIKSIVLESSQSIFSYYMYLVLWMLIYFLILPVIVYNV